MRVDVLLLYVGALCVMFAFPKVLELGAGTGLVGLALAACGAHVVLTELEGRKWLRAKPSRDYNTRNNRNVDTKYVAH